MGSNDGKSQEDSAWKSLLKSAVQGKARLVDTSAVSRLVAQQARDPGRLAREMAIVQDAIGTIDPAAFENDRELYESYLTLRVAADGFLEKLEARVKSAQSAQL